MGSIEMASGGWWSVAALGDVDIGAYKLKTTNHLLKQQDTDYLSIRNVGDTAYSNLYLRSAAFTIALTATADGAKIQASDVDARSLIMEARDAGVGLVSVARLVGAADAYLEGTLGIRLAPVAQWGTPVQGALIYNSATNKLNFYNGTAWETVTSA